MKLSNRRWFQVKEILFISLFWALALDIFVLVRFFGWDKMGEDMVVFLIPLSISKLFVYSTVGGLVIGLVTGSFEVLVIPRKLNLRSFGEVVGIKTLVYLIIIMLVVLMVRVAAFSKFQYDLVDEGLEASVQFFFSLTFLPILVYCLFISVLIGVLLQVNKKFGPGILWKLFVGQYHRPKEEERIFMFLDLTSSTTIAEKLGHVRYSRLIQDCFQDLSDILLEYQAHIYQFVGDEAVITWPMESGLYNGNCIRIYYGFDQQLKNREEHYLKTYELFPRFKASLNIGKVSVAEVGDIKSEIAYHGDVLNTGARILEQCNVHQKELLISGSLETRLQSSNIRCEFMDELQLRGKEGTVQIYSADLE